MCDGLPEVDGRCNPFRARAGLSSYTVKVSRAEASEAPDASSAPRHGRASVAKRKGSVW